MDSSTLILLACVGGVIFFLWRRKEVRIFNENAPQAMTNPPPEQVTEPEIVKTKSVEEIEVERAKLAFDVRATERTTQYESHQSQLREAEQKLAKASEYVRKSGLDLAVPFLWEEMKHWPSWLSNQEGRWKVPFPVTDVSGERSNSYRQGKVKWRWEDVFLAVGFKQLANYGPVDDDLEFADFVVEVDDVQVLKISCCRNSLKEFDKWRFVNVDALTVGPWMSKFVDYYGVLRNFKERESNQRHTDYIANRVNLIDLGE